MVKRAIAMLLGAVAGVLLWHLVDWLRAPAQAEDISVSVEDCVQYAYVDCVADREPAAAEALPEAAIAQPCKDWLSEEAGVAALSQCLHEVRRERDAVRIENFRRAQRIASAS